MGRKRKPLTELPGATRLMLGDSRSPPAVRPVDLPAGRMRDPPLAPGT